MCYCLGFSRGTGLHHLWEHLKLGRSPFSRRTTGSHHRSYSPSVLSRPCPLSKNRVPLMLDHDALVGLPSLGNRADVRGISILSAIPRRSSRACSSSPPPHPVHGRCVQHVDLLGFTSRHLFVARRGVGSQQDMERRRARTRPFDPRGVCSSISPCS